MANKIGNGCKTFFWALGYPLVGLHALIRLTVLKRKNKKYQKNPEDFLPEERYKIVNTIVKAVRYLKHVKITNVEGKEKIARKAQLIICNHRSNLDPILLYGFLYEKLANNFVFVAKKELKDSKLGHVFDFVDTLYLDRDNLRDGIKLIEKQKEILKSGKIVVVFPEGTRNTESELLEFKPGAFEPAYAALTPILPLIITNTNQHLEDKKQYKGERKPIELRIMDEVKPTNFVSIDRVNLAKNLQRKMQEEYDKMMQQENKKSCKESKDKKKEK